MHINVCVCAFVYNLEIAIKKSTMATKKKMLVLSRQVF